MGDVFSPCRLVKKADEKVEKLMEKVFEEFPVEKYPEKIKSLNFDKDPDVEGVLQGIKGQYLILDTGVINIRKFGGYLVEFSDQSDFYASLKNSNPVQAE